MVDVHDYEYESGWCTCTLCGVLFHITKSRESRCPGNKNWIHETDKTIGMSILKNSQPNMDDHIVVSSDNGVIILVHPAEKADKYYLLKSDRAMPNPYVKSRSGCKRCTRCNRFYFPEINDMCVAGAHAAAPTEDYALRIVPSWRELSKKMYRGNPNFKIGNF
jgi:hypothetical protein